MQYNVLLKKRYREELDENEVPTAREVQCEKKVTTKVTDEFKEIRAKREDEV
jgi:hypothetical protein